MTIKQVSRLQWQNLVEKAVALIRQSFDEAQGPITSAASCHWRREAEKFISLAVLVVDRDWLGALKTIETMDQDLVDEL